MQSCRVSIVAPVFNEEAVLREYYESIRSVMDKIEGTWELILVNDGSRDQSLEMIRELGQQDRRVKIINLSRNFGQQIAITAGIDYAIGEAVIIMDADLQDPPDIIPELIASWQKGNDVVYAVRDTRKGETILKRLTAALFYRLMRGITSLPMPMDAGDFRLLSRRAIDTLCQFRESHRFIRGMVSWIGFEQTNIHYQRAERRTGSTHYGYAKMIQLALDAITSFSYLPLRVATFLGVGVCVIAFLLAVGIVYLNLTRNFTAGGSAALAFIILFLGGIQLIGIGMIGEYIGRIYDEVRRRPLYIIRDLMNFDHESTADPPQHDGRKILSNRS